MCADTSTNAPILEEAAPSSDAIPEDPDLSELYPAFFQVFGHAVAMVHHRGNEVKGKVRECKRARKSDVICSEKAWALNRSNKIKLSLLTPRLRSIA